MGCSELAGAGKTIFRNLLIKIDDIPISKKYGCNSIYQFSWRVHMYKPVIEMEKILRKEKEFYDDLYRLENEKSEAILKRDWKLLEAISLDQSGLFPDIEKMESRREELIEEYRKVNNLDDLDRVVKLRDIVLSMDEDSSLHMLQLGIDLREVIVKVNSLVKTNNVLINDNLEFFNILISGLKNGRNDRIGYDSRGKEDNIKTAAPVIFNQTA